MLKNRDNQNHKIEISQDIAIKIIEGKLTIKQVMNLSTESLYKYAEIGYDMLMAGKLEEAKKIYSGLVAIDPYDSVFNCHLATIYHRLNDYTNALKYYNKSVTCNRSSIDALAGRGELHIRMGNFKDAFDDLQKVVDLDPAMERASTRRARALLMSLKQAKGL
jgi:tetratricopeptide (TPR) repeat protein